MENNTTNTSTAIQSLFHEGYADGKPKFKKIKEKLKPKCQHKKDCTCKNKK